MTLRFIAGPSGSGKTAFVTEEMTRSASSHPKKRFFCIVPDQFTMEMQKAMVLGSPRLAIMNIEVLSFGRLVHRIFEELGEPDLTYLDDTGKNLIIERIIRELGGELSVFGQALAPSMIHEIKSAISEFMLYAVTDEKIDILIETAEKRRRPALAEKLRDLKKIYGYFIQETEGRFTTIEGQVGLLKSMIKNSALLRGAEVVFDGFTGFTPVQIEVITELLIYCGRVSFTLVGERKDLENPSIAPQELFALSKRTMASLRRAAESVGCRQEDVVWCPVGAKGVPSEPSGAPSEPSGARGSIRSFAGEDGTTITALGTPREEAAFVGRRIQELTRLEGYAYRDIAVLCADMDAYGSALEREFEKRQIPCFIDRPSRLCVNPVSELVMSALCCVETDFRAAETTEYLRNLFSPLSPEECDFLEGFIARRGIRGASRWRTPYFGREPGLCIDDFNRAEALRERVEKSLSMLDGRMHPAAGFTGMLRDFLSQNDVQTGIEEEINILNAAGQTARADELSQVYDYMLGVFEVIEGLSPDAAITLGTFREMLGAALEEIKIGTIPRSGDRVLAGDLERTRLSDVKVLFLVGANDGSIPRVSNKGGIISDLDRLLLCEAAPDIELAPSPRELMYRQRLYLYMCIMKPSERLYVSYALSDAAGAKKQPSYLVSALMSRYDSLESEFDENPPEKYMELSDGLSLLSDALRGFAAGLPQDDASASGTLGALYELCRRDERMARILCSMTEGAFYAIKNDNITPELAQSLYGSSIRGSVSRLQTFASCPYRYFLTYGMELREPPSAEVDYRLGGDLLHEILCLFGKRLQDEGLRWDEIDEEKRNAIFSDVMAEIERDPLYEPYALTGKSRYQEKYMTRVARTSVDVLTRQLSAGEFLPSKFEERLALSLPLSKGRRMLLSEIIDRIDVYQAPPGEDGEAPRYVKVVDYKTGREDFSFSDTATGKKLQLPVYLRTAVENEKAAPAAMLYCRAADPMLEVSGDTGDEDIGEMRLAELSPKGLVNSDEGVLTALDRDFSGKKSPMLPPEAGRVRGDDLMKICDYSLDLCTRLAEGIVSGDIGAEPWAGSSTLEDPCGYCPYIGTCKARDPGSPPTKARPKVKTAEDLMAYIDQQEAH